MAAGSIIIDLLMRTGSFETDTARSGKALKQFQKDAEAAGKAVGVAFTGAVTGLAVLVKSTIDSADHLNDLSKKTGIAVDTLGGIGFAAGQAGGDLESASAAAGKLNKSLAEAAAGNKDVKAAFSAMGVSVTDATGKTKAADVALAEIADKFAGYADGPEKAALALKIFGKAGADIIPLLDDGGKALLDNIEYFKRYSGVTQDTAEKADQFNDTLGKIKLLSGAFAQTLTSELLPPLQNLADLWLKNKEQGDGFHATAERLADVFKAVVVGIAYVGTTAAITGDQLGALFAKFNALAHGDFKSFSSIGKDASTNLDKARKDFSDFYDAIYNGRKKADSVDYGNEGRNHPSGAKPAAPRLPAAGAGADAAAALKKQLDGQLKLIQDFGRQQADGYQFANQYLDGVYSDGLISQQKFFDAQKSLRDADLQSKLDAFDKEIAAEKAFIANPAAKPADRVAAEEKIKLAVQQRSDAVTKASAADILAAQANARAAQQTADAYDDLRASVLAASGDDFGAAQIRIAKQFRDAQKLITDAGGDPQLAIDQQRQAEQQAVAAKLQKDYGKLLDDNQRKEAEIYADAAAGGQGELDTLAKIRDARQAAIGQLKDQADAARALADWSKKPDDIKHANDLALAYKKALGEIDPLAKQFNGIFKDSFSDSFSSFLDGTKSAKDAFRDFTNSIRSDLSKLASKDIASWLFGGDSDQGGVGALLSSAFGGGGKGGASTGGGGGGSSGTGLLSSIFSGASALFNGASWSSLFAGSGGATAAASSSDLAAIFGSAGYGGAFAGGGRPPMNKASLVGEKGPEWFVPNTAGVIVPNDQSFPSRGQSVTRNTSIVVNPPPGMSKPQGQQFAADLARQLSIADRRNN